MLVSGCAGPSNPRPSYGLTVNDTALDPWALHEFELVAVTDPAPTVLVPLLVGLYTYTTAVSGCAICVAEIAAVICLLLTNDVVRGEPFQTTTALLLKLPPFTVSENPAPPAVALLGESEVIEGVAGQPPQETTGSNKITNALKSADIFVAIGVHIRQVGGRSDSQGRDFERIISVAIQLVVRIDMII